MARTFRPEVIEAGQILRISWDNRHVPRDREYLVTLLLLGSIVFPIAAISGCVGVGLVSDVPWYGRLFAIMFGSIWWLVVICMGYDMLARRWFEWVEVSTTAITVGRRGFLAPGLRVIPIVPSVELFFGRYEDSDTRSIRASLEVISLFSPWGTRRRVEIGRWLHVSAKEHVFQTLKAFMAASHIPVKTVRDFT